MSDICVAFDPRAAAVVTRHHPTHAAARQIAAIGEDVGDAPELALALESLGHAVRLLPLGEGAAAQLLGLATRPPDLVFNLCDTLQGRGTGRWRCRPSVSSWGWRWWARAPQAWRCPSASTT